MVTWAQLGVTKDHQFHASQRTCSRGVQAKTVKLSGIDEKIQWCEYVCILTIFHHVQIHDETRKKTIKKRLENWIFNGFKASFRDFDDSRS